MRTEHQRSKRASGSIRFHFLSKIAEHVDVLYVVFLRVNLSGNLIDLIKNSSMVIRSRMNVENEPFELTLFPCCPRDWPNLRSDGWHHIYVNPQVIYVLESDWNTSDVRAIFLPSRSPHFHRVVEDKGCFFVVSILGHS